MTGPTSISNSTLAAIPAAQWLPSSVRFPCLSTTTCCAFAGTSSFLLPSAKLIVTAWEPPPDPQVLRARGDHLFVTRPRGVHSPAPCLGTFTFGVLLREHRLQHHVLKVLSLQSAPLSLESLCFLPIILATSDDSLLLLRASA